MIQSLLIIIESCESFALFDSHCEVQHPLFTLTMFYAVNMNNPADKSLAFLESHPSGLTTQHGTLEGGSNRAI